MSAPVDRFAQAGALRADYDAVDWSTTPLGPVESWSVALRSAVDLMLPSKFPMTLLWGPERTLVYNEAYVELIGDKHPVALGSRAVDIFPEAWSVIGPLLDEVAAHGEARYLRDAAVPLQRHGFVEECHFTFCYSPVHGADGRIEGVLDIANETTREVLARRRLQLLSRLGDELLDVERLDDLPGAALAVLATAADDLREVELHLPDQDPAERRLPTVPPGDLAETDVRLEQTRRGRVAWVPLGGGRRRAGPDGAVLVVRLSDHLAPDASYRDFLRLIAASLARAWERLSGAEAQRSLSEALQRSLLTVPIPVGSSTVAVRYQPAAEQAQVGGDWHDSFRLADGSLAVVVGDVAGHDQHAASAMGQVRNLTRGVAVTLQADTAATMTGLDRAMHDLEVGVVATAVLGQLEGGAGTPVLRWTNAGHPPPALLHPDGRVGLLETEPDLLLGVDPASARTEHRLEIPAGASVVLYTDGLVERRDRSLTDGMTWLRTVLANHQHLHPEALCDHLLRALAYDVGGAAEDDVALLVLRPEPPGLR